MRVEIARQLGIRDQHVRNVLLSSGITGGLKREVLVEREPVAVPIKATGTPQSASAQVLLESGFSYIGDWELDAAGRISLGIKVPKDPGVYAFVIDDRVVYVGLTKSGLHRRFDQYRRGHKRQRTSARINQLILKELASGKEIKVLIATPPPSEWNWLPVDTAAGLESGLIKGMSPIWNIMGAQK